MTSPSHPVSPPPAAVRDVSAVAEVSGTDGRASRGTKHTPGPWSVFAENRTVKVWGPNGPRDIIVHWTGFDACNKHFAVQVGNARLIAAAPDHALVAWALASGLARYERFATAQTAGELCVLGLRYTTDLDDFGVPMLADHTRAILAKARGQS